MAAGHAEYGESFGNQFIQHCKRCRALRQVHLFCPDFDGQSWG
jgi:ribosome-binding ATPase YchF (GTP1/OBG family)